MSSEENGHMVGSPDSGVEESLTSSLVRMVLGEEEGVQTNAEHEPFMKGSSDGKGDERRLSLSSEGTSTTDDRENSNSLLTKAERVALIRELLETYLSDNYLTRDIFLLKHFRKSKDGWISLKFMASYKRIKRITKKTEEVEEAVKLSPLLELNDEGNKVRRLAPLPTCLEKYIPTRMALIGSLRESFRSLTTLSKFVSAFGEVASIQILRPGINLPDFLSDTAANYPQVREQWCAVVEFDGMDSAKQCVSTITESDEEPTMWAIELVMPWRNKGTENTNIISSDSMKNRCRSCPSSGYSSPILTPEQSPVAYLRSNREVRGVTKRERININRSKMTPCCHSFVCHHQLQYPPCQHPTFSPTYSPIQKKHSHRRLSECNCRSSPKRYVSQATTGSDCDNWRLAPAAQ